MAWDGMGAFVRALEQRGELVRVRQLVDARFEIAAVADRVVKQGGPALLFENVPGARFPLPALSWTGRPSPSNQENSQGLGLRRRKGHEDQPVGGKQGSC